MTRRNKEVALNDTGDLPVYKPVERLGRRSQWQPLSCEYDISRATIVALLHQQRIKSYSYS